MLPMSSTYCFSLPSYCSTYDAGGSSLASTNTGARGLSFATTRNFKPISFAELVQSTGPSSSPMCPACCWLPVGFLAWMSSQLRNTLTQSSVTLAILKNRPRLGPTLIKLATVQSCEKRSPASRWMSCVGNSSASGFSAPAVPSAALRVGYLTRGRKCSSLR